MSEKKELTGLIERVQNGDLEAFGVIYDRYFDRVYAYVFRQVGTPADADDITAGIFLEAIQKIDSFTWRGAGFSGWIFTIARNDVMDFFRKNGGRRRETAMTDEVDRMPSGAETDSQLERKWDEEHLRRAVLMLPDDQQQVILLKLMLNLSNKQVGEILEKSEGAVKALRHRAIKSLKKHMDSDKVNDVCRV